jgi:hypothetical protein
MQAFDSYEEKANKRREQEAIQQEQAAQSHDTSLAMLNNQAPWMTQFLPPAKPKPVVNVPNELTPRGMVRSTYEESPNVPNEMTPREMFNPQYLPPAKPAYKSILDSLSPSGISRAMRNTQTSVGDTGNIGLGEKVSGLFSFGQVPSQLETPKTVYRNKYSFQSNKYDPLTENINDTSVPYYVIGESGDNYYYMNDGQLFPLPKSEVTDTQMPQSEIDRLRQQNELQKNKLESQRTPISKFGQRVHENINTTLMGQGAQSQVDSGSGAANVMADLLGQGLGYLAPIGGLPGTNSLASASETVGNKLISKLFPKLNQSGNAIARNAAIGSATMPLISLYESSGQNLSPEDTAKKLAIETLAGGAIGGGIGGVSKLANLIKNNPTIRNNVVGYNYDDLVNAIKNNSDLPKTNNIGQSQTIRLANNSYDNAANIESKPNQTPLDDIIQQNPTTQVIDNMPRTNDLSLEQRIAEAAKRANENDALYDNYLSTLDPKNKKNTIRKEPAVINDEYYATIPGYNKHLDSLMNSNKPVKEAPLQTTQSITDNVPQSAPKANSLSKEIQDKLNALDKKYNINIENTKKTLFNDELKQKQLQALGMKKAAEKRQIIQDDSLIPVEGGLTSTELNNKIKKLKSNYLGKAVITQDGEGVIVKNSFGKVGVKYPDGTIKYYDASSIKAKNDIDAIIEQQIAKKKELEITGQSFNPQQPIQQSVPLNEPMIQKQMSQNNIQDNVTAPPIQNNIAPKVNRLDPNLPTKESQFKTNTLYNAEGLQDPKVKKSIEEAEYIYNYKSDDYAVNKAVTDLSNDFDGTYNRIKTTGVQNKEDMVAAKFISEQLAKNGDIDRLHDFTKNSVQPEVSNIAQMMQSLNLWKPDSIEGAMIYSNKIAKSYEKQFQSIRPDEYANIMSKVDTDVSKITKLLDEEISKGLNINLQLFAEKLKKVAKLPKNYVDQVVKTALKTEDGILKYNIDDITDIVKQKYNMPTVTKKDTAEMLSYWKEAQKYDPDSYGYRFNMYKAANVLPKKLPTTAADILKAMHGWSLFFNTITLEKIFGGNVLSFFVNNPEQRASSFLDVLASLVTGKRTIAAPNEWVQAKGIRRRAVEIGKDWWNDVDTSTFNNSFDFRYTSPFKDGPGIKGQASKYTRKIVDNSIRGIFSLMENTFKQGMYDDVVRREMKLHNINAKKSGQQLITKPTQEMIDYAKNQAEKVVFADYNKLVDAAYKLRTGLNKTNKVLDYMVFQPLGKGMIEGDKFGIGDLLLPVMRTVINMSIWAAEHSPAQFIRGVVGRDQKDIIEGLVKGGVGAGLVFGGVKAAEAGMATASPDQNKNARDFNVQQKKQPYSVSVGGKNFATDWAQPYSTLFNIGSELGQGKKNEDPVMAAVDLFINQSFISSLNRVVGGGYNYGTKAENITEAILNTGTQIVPGLVNQISKTIDPVQREAKNPLDRIINRTPLKTRLPAKTDNQGNILTNDVVNTWANPSNTKNIKNQNASTKEMERLYKKSGEVKQFIPKLPDEVTIKKNTTTFTEQERLQAQKIFYSNVMSEFDKIISNNKKSKLGDETVLYSSAKNDDEKAAILSSIISQQKQDVLDSLLKQKGINPKTGKKK